MEFDFARDPFFFFPFSAFSSVLFLFRPAVLVAVAFESCSALTIGFAGRLPVLKDRGTTTAPEFVGSAVVGNELEAVVGAVVVVVVALVLVLVLVLPQTGDATTAFEEEGREAVCRELELRGEEGGESTFVGCEGIWSPFPRMPVSFARDAMGCT